MRSIRNHVGQLKALYERNDYPSDRLIREARSLHTFTTCFNGVVGANFSTDEVAAELERVRKDKANTGGLPKIGRSFAGPTLS